MKVVPGREGTRGSTCFCLFVCFVFGPIFQNPLPDSELEGSGLWSVEAKERRVSGLALGSMKGMVAVLFFKKGFLQGSL